MDMEENGTPFSMRMVDLTVSDNTKFNRVDTFTLMWDPS